MFAMSGVMRAGLRVALAATALGVSPVLAQTAEPVKTPPAKASSFDFGGKNVFDHAIPNAEGKSMVAILVNYPPGGTSPPHHHAPSAFIYAYAEAPSAAKSTMNPLKPTKRAKVSMNYPARATGSAKTRVTSTPRPCWPFTSSIPPISR